MEKIRNICEILLVKPRWNEAVAYPGIFFGGVSTNSVEDRGQNGDLGVVAP
jgi:hypothetical protein